MDEINGLAAYQWWEGSVYSIISAIAYPLAWSWLQWRRKKKIHALREYVRSEYDHACMRSCRSRALYEGLKVNFFLDCLFKISQKSTPFHLHDTHVIVELFSNLLVIMNVVISYVCAPLLRIIEVFEMY